MIGSNLTAENSLSSSLEKLIVQVKLLGDSLRLLFSDSILISELSEYGRMFWISLCVDSLLNLSERKPSLIC